MAELRQLLFGPATPPALTAFPRYLDRAGEVITSTLHTVAIVDDALGPLLHALGRSEGQGRALADARHAVMAVVEGCERAPYGPKGLRALHDNLRDRLAQLATYVLDPLPPGSVIVRSAQALQAAVAAIGTPQAWFMFNDQRGGAIHCEGGADTASVEDVSATLVIAAAAARRDAHNIPVELSRLSAALEYVPLLVEVVASTFGHKLGVVLFAMRFRAQT